LLRILQNLEKWLNTNIMPKLMSLITKIRTKYAAQPPAKKLNDYEYEDPYITSITKPLDLTIKNKDANIKTVNKFKGK
jgi:hypothetical protein